ncbi:MAG: dTMP kinase [Pseudohongiellaceae bacterium]
MNRGIFITIEGVEGVGKSTNIEFIKQYLDNLNIDYLVTREPGGTLLAENIRDLLLSIDDDSPVELCELLLIFSARAQHIQKVIEPALERGIWVICDRFTDATYAYQGGGRGMNTGLISELETMVQGSLRPDLTIILDLDPETGLRRARNRGELDRFEREHVEFFIKVREAYLQIATDFPKRCAVINAGKELGEVSRDIALLLKTRLFEE